jgi:hypothetical protein
MENNLEIKSFEEFYSFVKEVEMNHEEVNKFITIMDAVPRSCGCVRGALHERAKALYERILPILEADSQDFLNKVKQTKQINKILFFSDGNLLLSV